MMCSTKLLDPANIWVIIPGPHWWQNRLCFNIAHDTKIEFTDHTVQYLGTSLRWLIYSAAREAERNRMSLNFLPPSVTADPPFNVFTSDEQTYIMPYCVEEEEEQWIHPWFRVHAATPHALAFCPSLLKLLRLKLILSPLYDNDHEIHNSYQIISRNGPRALLASHYNMIKTCLGMPNGTSAIVTDALSGDTCLVGWIEAGANDDICPFSLACIGRAPVRLVLPRSSPEVDNPRCPPHVHVDDQVDLDPHDSDMLSAPVDFDEYGNELDCDDSPSDNEDPD
jgi:hypothetical protein